MSRHRDIKTVRKERIKQFRDYLCRKYFLDCEYTYDNALIHHQSFIDTKWGSIIHDETILLTPLTTFIYKYRLRISLTPYDQHWDEL